MELVKNAKKYYGQYVATRSFKSRDVVAFGKSIIDVVKRAKKMGVEEPVVHYVMDPNIPHIYTFA
jgi:hypothetical protein